MHSADRADLSDLVRCAPATMSSVMERASNAFDAGNMQLAADLVNQAAQSGLLTWHARAAQLSVELERHTCLETAEGSTESLL